MTFDRAKILAEGGTYFGASNLLVESGDLIVTGFEMVPVSQHGTAPSYIKEDASAPKRMVIEGVFQRAGVRNANQRVYPLTLWERLLDPKGSVMQRVRERAMIGHLEHPTEGTTDLNKGAILITEVWMEKDGTVKGRALVYNTPEGQRIQEYVVTGTKIGISSRGTGTVDAKGTVCEDFALETWDMVYNPSTPGANPTLKTTESVAESREPAVQPQPVVESKPATDTISPQDKPMTLFERISAVTADASRLLATDAKKLTVEARRKLRGEMIEMKVKIAEEFTGEKRVSDVTALLAKLDKAISETDANGGFTADTTGAAAPEGQVATGVPGTWDALDKALAGAGDGKAKALEHTTSVANLIAANLGKLPQIAAAVEAVVKETVDAEKAEMKDLLSASRDEIVKMTETVEAATAIAEELKTRLQAEIAKRAEESAAAQKLITDLTAKIAGQTQPDPKTTAEAAPVVAKPAVTEAAKPKTLAERIAEQAKAQNADDSTLPRPGQVAESTKDAGDVEAKKSLSEDAEKDVTEAKTKVSPKVLKAVTKKLTEAFGSFK